MSVILGGVLGLLLHVYTFSFFFFFLFTEVYLAFYFSTCIKSALQRVLVRLGKLSVYNKNCFLELLTPSMKVKICMNMLEPFSV